MAEKVRIIFEGKDETGAASRSVLSNFQKISNIGMKLTGMFTAPAIGLGILLSKNEELQKSLVPLKTAFDGVINDLAIGLVPVIRDLTPMIVGLIKGVGDLVKQFNDLPLGQKETILKFVGLGIILGPIIYGIGQVGIVMNSLGIVFGGASVGIWAAVAPLLAVGAAVYTLIKLVQMDEFKKVLALLWGGVGTMVTGDSRRGAMATQSLYSSLGGGQPGGSETGDFVRGLFGGGVTSQQSAAAGAPFVFNYNPGISTASQYEAEQKLKPMIEQILRQSNGR